MSNATITYDDREVQEALVKAINLMGTLEPAMKNIGEYSTREVQRRFDRQVDPDGNPWADLKPSTWARKKSRKILQEQGGSGGLLGSINYRAGADFLEIGTNKPYAAVLQFGAKKGEFGMITAMVRSHPVRNFMGKGKTVIVGDHSRTQELPWGDIPARPFLGFGEPDKQEIIVILADYMGFGGNFRG